MMMMIIVMIDIEQQMKQQGSVVMKMSKLLLKW